MKYDNTPENSQAWRNRARERANRYWRKAYSDEEVREIAEEVFYEACRWLSEKIREEIREKGIWRYNPPQKQEIWKEK